MRIPELIQMIFALLLATLAWLRPLPRARRLKVNLLAVLVIVSAVLIRSLGSVLAPAYSSIAHHWFPAVLFLLPYWQAGQFFVGPNQKCQQRLAMLDEKLFGRVLEHRAPASLRVVLAVMIEIAYIAVYPLVPLGLLMLYILGCRRYIDYYWIVVLTSTYLCCVVTLFVPALPPWCLTVESLSPATKVRRLNLQILRKGGIRAITFPSAHVASAAAVALVFLRLSLLVGGAFAAVALSIAVAAVAGRYHYALDAVSGLILALLVFVLTYGAIAI